MQDLSPVERIHVRQVAGAALLELVDGRSADAVGAVEAAADAVDVDLSRPARAAAENIVQSGQQQARTAHIQTFRHQ